MFEIFESSCMPKLLDVKVNNKAYVIAVRHHMKLEQFRLRFSTVLVRFPDSRN